MTKKEKELEKSKKIKNIIKWSLVGVGWSALCFCFVGLLVLGIQGCANKQKKNAQNNVTMPIAQPRIMRAQEDLIVNTKPYYLVDSFNASYEDYGLSDYDGNTYYFEYGGFVNDVRFDKVLIDYSVDIVSEDVGYLSWSLVTSDDLPIRIISFDSSDIEENTWSIGDKLVFDTEFMGDQVLNEFLLCFTQYDSFDFTFNDMINPFAPIGSSNDYFHSGSYQGSYPLLTGLFETATDGTLYTSIEIGYYTANSVRYGTSDSYRVNELSGTFQYMYLAYIRKSDNKQIIVNSVRYVNATSGEQAGQSVLTNTNFWVSPIFKSIKVYYLQNNTTLPLKNYSARELLSAFNNMGNFDGLTPSTTDIGGNPLELIGKAFSGLAGLFGITIIPGITLGVLLFLPLTAGIVLAIVKVVRK